MSREEALHESEEGTRGTDASGEGGVKKRKKNSRWPSGPLGVGTRTRTARTSEANTDDVSGMKNGRVDPDQADSDEEADAFLKSAMGGHAV